MIKADVSQRARELLAAEYSTVGLPVDAHQVRERGGGDEYEAAALRAIEVALSSQPVPASRAHICSEIECGPQGGTCPKAGEATASPVPAAGVVEERASVVAWLREQSEKGAELGIDKEEGSTARAAYGGGSLALKRAADEIEQGGHVGAVPEVVCEGCGKPVLRGQFVHCYEDVGEVHVNCDRPNDFSVDPAACVLVGDPLIRARLSPRPRKHGNRSGLAYATAIRALTEQQP